MHVDKGQSKGQVTEVSWGPLDVGDHCRPCHLSLCDPACSLHVKRPYLGRGPDYGLERSSLV